MKSAITISKFRELWNEAKVAHDRSANASDYENSFEDVLNFILAHEPAQQDLENEVIAIYRDPQRCIPDLLEFCMALLRWPRMREELIADVSNAIDMRRRTCAANILSAYSDEWDGSGVYRFYTPDSPTT